MFSGAHPACVRYAGRPVSSTRSPLRRSDDGNHAHAVLRRPRGDFGTDVLAGHLRDADR